MLQFSLSRMSSSVGGLTLSEAAEVKKVTQSRTVLSIGMIEIKTIQRFEVTDLMRRCHG